MSAAHADGHPRSLPISSPRPYLTLAGWFACIAIPTFVLLRSGSVLPSPPLSSEISQWLTRAPAPVIVFALLRWVGLLVGGYLTIVTMANLLAVKIPVLLRAVDAITIPQLGRFLRCSVGVGLLASTTLVLPASARTSTDTPSVNSQWVSTNTDVITMTRLDGPSAGSPVDGSTDNNAVGDTTVTMQVIPTTPTTIGPPPATIDSTTPPGADRITEADSDTVDSGSIEPSTVDSGTVDSGTVDSESGVSPVWTIRPGEHLWYVCEVTLTEAWGRVPGDDDVLDYLIALIDLNRDVLAVPDNPDLVFAGQTFALPRLSAG